MFPVLLALQGVPKRVHEWGSDRPQLAVLIWVVGLEADFQGAPEKDSSTITNAFNLSLDPFPETVTESAITSYQAKIDWFGTVRLRAGHV